MNPKIGYVARHSAITVYIGFQIVRQNTPYKSGPDVDGLTEQKDSAIFELTFRIMSN